MNCGICKKKATVAFVCEEHGFIRYLNSEELEQEREDAKRKFDEVTGDKTMLEKLITVEEENLELIELIDTFSDSFNVFLQSVSKVFKDKKEKELVGKD